MANFMRFTTIGGGSVYINRDFISAFRYVTPEDVTVYCIAGTEKKYMLRGDQTQKILDGRREPDNG